MQVLFVLACVAVDLPLFVLIGKLFYNDIEDFLEGIRFWITPDIISAFRGEYWDDLWEEWKLFAFISACGAFVIGEYYLFDALFQRAAV